MQSGAEKTFEAELEQHIADIGSDITDLELIVEENERMLRIDLRATPSDKSTVLFHYPKEREGTRYADTLERIYRELAEYHELVDYLSLSKHGLIPEARVAFLAIVSKAIEQISESKGVQRIGDYEAGQAFVGAFVTQINADVSRDDFLRAPYFFKPKDVPDSIE